MARLRNERFANSHLRRHVPGSSTDPAHMPESHRRSTAWTPGRVFAWAAKTGPATAKLAEAILDARPHPEQGFRSPLGIVRLGERYGADGLRATMGSTAISRPAARNIYNSTWPPRQRRAWVTTGSRRPRPAAARRSPPGAPPSEWELAR